MLIPHTEDSVRHYWCSYFFEPP